MVVFPNVFRIGRAAIVKLGNRFYICTAIQSKMGLRLRCSLIYCYTGHGRQACANIIHLINQNKMETKILRVVRQGEAFGVQSAKAEGGSIQKCNIVLRELGGSKFENEYVCAMLGNLAACKFYEGDVVAATLRFSTHEYQGQTFQEILATDIVKLNH